MVLIPDDILFSIAQYGGEPPVDPMRLIENIMEIYPIFSFKREYHLRLLQDEVKKHELYRAYEYIRDTFPNFFKSLDDIYIIRDDVDISKLDPRFKIRVQEDKYVLDVNKELKIELFTIHRIFNPFITASTNRISTRTFALEENTLCGKLLAILALQDDSLDQSYEFYIKTVQLITDQFNLAEVYRQCVIEAREVEIMKHIYDNNDSLRLFHDIVNSEDVTIIKKSKYMRVIGTNISDIRLRLIGAGFDVTAAVAYNYSYVGEFGVTINPRKMITVYVPKKFSKNYFRLEAAKNPYIRRCYYSNYAW